jgi:hypothetical protein
VRGLLGRAAPRPHGAVSHVAPASDGVVKELAGQVGRRSG